MSTVSLLSLMYTHIQWLELILITWILSPLIISARLADTQTVDQKPSYWGNCFSNRVWTAFITLSDNHPPDSMSFLSEKCRQRSGCQSCLPMTYTNSLICCVLHNYFSFAFLYHCQLVPILLLLLLLLLWFYKIQVTKINEIKNEYGTRIEKSWRVARKYCWHPEKKKDE